MMRVYLTRPGARRAVVDKFGSCAYEAQIEGQLQRCAIGCLLSPAGLSETILVESDCLDALDEVELREFLGALQEAEDAGFLLPELGDASRDFLGCAQQAHDAQGNWPGGKFNVSKLDDLAREFGLTVVVDDPTVTVGAPREEVVVA